MSDCTCEYCRDRNTRNELRDLKAKLAFLKSKGLTVGEMKSSDNPEPYLVYVIERDSELCDMRAVNKLVDAEIALDRLRWRYEEAVTLLVSIRERDKAAVAELVAAGIDEDQLDTSSIVYKEIETLLTKHAAD
jgi:hypothetical protein